MGHRRLNDFSLSSDPLNDIDTAISTPDNFDHAGRHAACPKAQCVIRRVHHLDAAGDVRSCILWKITKEAPEREEVEALSNRRVINAGYFEMAKVDK